MKKETTSKRITFGVNCALFVYLVFVELVSHLFDIDADRRVPMDSLFEIAPAISLVLAILLVLGLIFGGAIALTVLWNRLVASLFSLRHLTYQEALSIVLLMSIIT